MKELPPDHLGAGSRRSAEIDTQSPDANQPDPQDLVIRPRENGGLRLPHAFGNRRQRRQMEKRLKEMNDRSKKARKIIDAREARERLIKEELN